MFVLSLSAYLKVFIVWSAELEPGLIQAIITILDATELIKESLNTIVSFEALNGMWPVFKSRALMHSFNASRLLFISAPSSLLCLLLLWQSAALSDPAKSTSKSLPNCLFPFEIESWQIAWDLEDVSFAVV